MFDGMDSPLLEDAIMRRLIEAANFENELHGGQLSDLGEALLADAFEKRGRFAARVVAIAMAETPIRIEKQAPPSHFLANEDEAGQQLAERAAEIFRQARRLKLTQSRLPFRAIRFSGMYDTPTNYRKLRSRVAPPTFTVPELKATFAEHYLKEAARLELGITSVAQGAKIIKRAPRKIHGIPLQPVEASDTARQFLTEHGAVLSLSESNLPHTVEMLETESRVTTIRAPRQEEVEELLGYIARNIRQQTAIKL